MSESHEEMMKRARQLRDAALSLERAQTTAMKLCVEACQRIAKDFEDGRFEGVTVGAIEDAVGAARKLEAVYSEPAKPTDGDSVKRLATEVIEICAEAAAEYISAETARSLVEDALRTALDDFHAAAMLAHERGSEMDKMREWNRLCELELANLRLLNEGLTSELEHLKGSAYTYARAYRDKEFHALETVLATTEKELAECNRDRTFQAGLAEAAQSDRDHVAKQLREALKTIDELNQAAIDEELGGL